VVQVNPTGIEGILRMVLLLVVGGKTLAHIIESLDSSMCYCINVGHLFCFNL